MPLAGLPLKRTALAILALVVATTTSRAADVDPDAAAWPAIDRIFETWRLDAHIPGLVYGVVVDGRLVHVKAFGYREVESRRPVEPDTLFRIASMSKAFTALAVLALRDQGRLSLDAPAETYVPEMKAWTYPTRDSRRIRVRDLLNHIGGFVNDDPWGDRQQPLPEADFTAMLARGVPFASPVGMRMEYSNFGYATLGRIVTNVSGRRYQDYVRETLMKPLGMASSGYDIGASPPTRRASGYRWEDDRWVREPDLADGAFGAMGGIETDAADYARWVAFLLSAWPARDDAETGPVARATVREIVEGSNFVAASMRPASIGGAPCRIARAYAMGWGVANDCDLGRVLSHAGGYPGYGSFALLLPDAGVGIFVFANRTYAGPGAPAFRAALALRDAKRLPTRASATSPRVEVGYATARAVWAAGRIDDASDRLASNVLLDRDAAHWTAELARLRKEVGACAAAEPVKALSAMEGEFTWTCEHGRIDGAFLLAPTERASLQQLEFKVARP